MADKPEVDSVRNEGEAQRVPEAEKLGVSNGNLVDTAVKFLQNPKVRNSPLSQKRVFLKSKGLRDEEIDEAVAKSGVAPNDIYPSHSPQDLAVLRSAVIRQPDSGRSAWQTFNYVFATAVVVSGALCGLFAFSKKYIFPFLFGFPSEEERLCRLEKQLGDFQTNVDKTMILLQQMLQELQTNIQLMNKKQDTLITAQSSQEIPRSLEAQFVDLRLEMSSVKSLLLNRHQFPAAPSFTPIIPPWQLGNKTEACNNVSGLSDKDLSCTSDMDVHDSLQNEDTPSV